jgi:hypothetical protein
MLASNNVVYGDVRWAVAVFSFFVQSLLLCAYTGAVVEKTAPTVHLGNNQMSNGSNGRWRYDSIYKDKPLRVASPRVDTKAASKVLIRNPISKTGQFVRVSNPNVTTASTAIPTAHPHVDPSARKFVQWFDDSMGYALNSTYDYRFKLRYAPVPAAGSPWPMPQSYMPSNISHRVDPHSFSFQMIGNSCPILQTNFKRIKRNIIGNADPSTSSYWSTGTTVTSLSITVLKKCTRYPYLEMDESCEYYISSCCRA